MKKKRAKTFTPLKEFIQNVYLNAKYDRLPKNKPTNKKRCKDCGFRIRTEGHLEGYHHKFIRRFTNVV